MLQLLNESRVASLIFDGVPTHSIDPPARDDQHVTINLSEDAAAEAFRHQQRATLRAATSIRNGAPRSMVVSTLRRSSWPPGFILIFDIKTSAADRTVLAGGPVALHVRLALPFWPERPRQIRRTIEDLLPALRTTVSPNLETAQRRQREAVRARYLDAAERMLRRDKAARSNHESAARELVQAGLFERRAKRDARSRHDELGFDGTVKDVASTDLISSADLRAVLVVRPR
jgi:hypothetical protein